MNEKPGVSSENFSGGSFSKNLRVDFSQDTERWGEFVLIEMPSFEICGLEELKARTKLVRENELSRYREKMAGRESILGETFKERIRNEAVSEVLKKYPELDIAKTSFYLNLIQNGMVQDWNFGGGLIAVEKAEPWGWSSSQSRLARRTNMTFEESLQLISENKEQILGKIGLEGTSRRVDLSTVTLGIPTLEEAIYLEAYHPEITSPNRGKSINRWTSTKVKLGGTDDEWNLVLPAGSNYHGEMFSMDPKESHINVGFDIIARFK